MDLKDDIPFSDFDKISTKDWWEKIDKDLKGQSLDTLYFEPAQGIRMAPFYHSDKFGDPSQVFQNQTFSSGERKDGSWKLSDVFSIEAGKEPEIQKLILESIDADADVLIFRLNEEFDSSKILSSLEKFNGTVILQSDRMSLLEKYRNKFDSENSFSLCSDPDLFNLILKSNVEIEQIFEDILKFYSEEKNYLIINSDGLINRGAEPLDETVYSLSLMNEIISRINTDGSIPQIVFRLNTSSDFFLNLSRLRAFRYLANFILKKWGLENEVIIECHTTLWNKSVYERFNNILRLTSESFSSLVGGADIMSVTGFEEALDIENAFTHRNARNISHLLRHESHLDKVSDMAAGSYFIEELTKEFAEKTWNQFSKVEAEGGFLQFLSDKDIHSFLKDKLQGKRELFSKGKISMVGTNTFPNPDDQLTVENISERRKERLAYDFENIRSAVELGDLNDKKSRPVAAILKLGKSQMKFARATFATNFLECAGIKIEEYDDIGDQLKDADLAVICSSDDEYLENAESWIKQLKSEFSDIGIILAGKPSNSADLEKSGVDFFIHLRSNLGSTLIEILKSLGIETS